MSPDRAQTSAVEPNNVAADGVPVTAGALEVLLPLWHRKWRLLVSLLVGAALAFGLSQLTETRFTAQASFVVQPSLRPSHAAVANALPALAGLVGGGTNPIDLYITILRSQTMADRIIERFDLHRNWQSRSRTETLMKLSKRVSFGSGRRDGLVQITVEDELPQRAAGIANQYADELRGILRGYAMDEARQRREFYDVQLERARKTLQDSQRELQASGFDRAALRTEPRAAAESYGRFQGEIAAAEVRLAATQRLRSDSSPEVQQLLSEIAALRAQLARIELPKDSSGGAFVNKLREFRYAEGLAESIARQAEAARVDEASDVIPLRLLDRATVPEWPSSPRVLVWLLAGALLGLATQGAWVLLRHRAALARLDPAYVQRVALLQSLLVKPRVKSRP